MLGHFCDGHFAVTSQTSLHLVQENVCVFVKRNGGLNEDLYHSEQFTYNVLCQLLPYNDITALWLHMNCFLLHPTVSEKNKHSFNSELELNLSKLHWPVWDVFFTFCFRQLNIRIKKCFLIRYLEVLDF